MSRDDRVRLIALLPSPESEPDPGWLDAGTLGRGASTAPAGQNPAACRAALALYGSEYLPEERYADWAERCREELRGLHPATLRGERLALSPGVC